MVNGTLIFATYQINSDYFKSLLYQLLVVSFAYLSSLGLHFGENFINTFLNFVFIIYVYSKICVKQPLKNRQNKDLNDKW